MRERRLTKQQVWDAIDCPEEEHEGRVLNTYVFKDREDGTFWRFSFRVSEENGYDVQDNTLAIEVEPVQVTVTQYQVKQ